MFGNSKHKKEIHELKKEIEKLKEQLGRDEFTGLIKWQHDEGIWSSHKVFKTAERYGVELWVALIDIDYLKVFNDQYSMPEVDTAIKVLVDALRDTVRSSDHIFRYGADEFPIILYDVSAQNLPVIFKRISTNFRDKVKSLVDNGSLLSGIENSKKHLFINNISFSVGVAKVRPLNSDRAVFKKVMYEEPNEALKRADFLLHSVAKKEKGRGFLVIEGVEEHFKLFDRTSEFLGIVSSGRY